MPVIRLAGLLLFSVGIGCVCGLQAPVPDSSRLPPRVVRVPGDRHSAESRRFQGIPSLAVSPGGRLWATWYAGRTPHEDRNNYVVVATSSNRGQSWKEVLVIDPDEDGPVRAFDPQIWLAPDGLLRVFWAQGLDRPNKLGSSGVWVMTASGPDEEDVRWSGPRRLGDGVMMGKPLVLSTGEWILPVSFWHRREAGSAGVVASVDGGETWSERGSCDIPPEVRSYDEHVLVERHDASLWMLVRTQYGIGESVSGDRGKTWSPLRESSIRHPAARFFVRRLDSGNLLLVKHGPISERTERAELTAFLSTDDGETWSDGLLLDERVGVSYPDGQQGADGTVYIVYDYSRTGEREILLARFTEKDVFAGTPGSPGSALRLVVSKVPEK